MPLGAVVVTVVAVLVGGWSCCARRGHAFVIITIALLLSMQVLVTNFKILTDGSNGVNVPLPFWSSTTRTCRSTTSSWSCCGYDRVRGVDPADASSAPGCWPSARTRTRRPRSASTPTRYKVLAYAVQRGRRSALAGVVYAYFLSLPEPDRRLQPADQRHDRALRARSAVAARCGGRSSARFVVHDRAPRWPTSTAAARRAGCSSSAWRWSSSCSSCRTASCRRRARGARAGSRREGRVHRPDRRRHGRGRRSSSRRGRHRASRADGRPAPRDPRRGQELRWPARRRRRRPHRRGGARSPRSSGRTARARPRCSTWSPARCRLGAGEIWFDGTRIDPHAGVGPGAPRAGPDLPDHPPVQEHDRAGERRGPAADRELGPHGARTPSAGTRPSGPASCWTSSASAASATSRPARCPTASRSSSSWPRCSCSSRR